MRVYRNADGNWKYEHVVLLGATGAGVPSKDVITPPCIVSPASSERVYTQKWTVDDTIVGIDTDNVQDVLYAHLSGLSNYDPLRKYLDVEYVKSNEAPYSMKTCLMYWFDKDSMARVWRLCCGFAYFLKGFTPSGNITTRLGLLPYRYIYKNQGIQESLFAANSHVDKAYVLMEYSFDNFNVVRANDVLATMRANDIMPNVRFPRFCASDATSTWAFPQATDLGFNEMNAWLQSEQEWYEEDYDVNTHWTKPASVLDLVNAYIMGNFTEGGQPIPDKTNFVHKLWNSDTGSGIFSSGLYNDPMQAILGLHFIPFTLPDENITGQRKDVIVGKKVITGPTISEMGMYALTDEYVEYEFGSKVISRIFNDYRDFTEVQLELYLPCIGWKTLDAQTYMGHELIIKYRVNFVTGDVVVLLITNPGNIIQDTVKGVASQNLPLSGSDYSRILQAKTGESIAALSGFVGLVGGALTGNPAMAAGALTASASSLMQAKANTSLANASVQKSGNIGSNAGYMSYPNAYVLVSYHEDAMPTGYQNYEGFQSNKILTISTLTGYIKAREAYFSSARATEQEKAMVEQMLKEGVFK